MINLDIDKEHGTISSLTIGGQHIPFRSDRYRGPAFQGVDMADCGDGVHFSGRRDSIVYSIAYKVTDTHLLVQCSICNEGNSAYIPFRERLTLGIDSEMLSFPQWDSCCFPTLLRCEKDYAWGYFSSPTGEKVVLATEEPVASYAHNYKYEEMLEWMWGHQIMTSSLDLLHEGPLPQRHPAVMDRIEAGQTLTWNLHLGTAESEDEVRRCVSEWSKAPQIDCESYTLEEGRTIRAEIIHNGKAKVVLIGPDGEKTRLKIHNGRLETASLRGKGIYKLLVSAGGKTSEADCYVRENWDWYLRKVRDFQLGAMPRVGNSCESFYGYFPAFEAAAEFPEPQKDSLFIDLLERSVSNIIDTVRWVAPEWVSLSERLQNYSSLAGIYTDLWRATADPKHLRTAGKLADYVCLRQHDDGSYRNNGIHYTAVIYPAKSIMDVALAEREAGLEENAARHMESAMRACLDLCDRLDDIETEGDMTFEDGMISCSALQMAYAALNTDNPELKSRLTEAAAYMMRKHECLEQRIIPDCRMRGATLRYWEALDTYFSPNQVMNSPHGWTAWKTYAMYYLYLLTGDCSYLEQLMDTLGACVQLMDLNGWLRWCFLPDPYVKALVAVPGENGWKSEERIVGEQYMDMISTWCKAPSDESYVEFGQDGGEGDGTVYEIFKAMHECVMCNAFVTIVDGRIRAWNCEASLDRHGNLRVEPAYPSVRTLILNDNGVISTRCICK